MDISSCRRMTEAESNSTNDSHALEAIESISMAKYASSIIIHFPFGTVSDGTIRPLLRPRRIDCLHMLHIIDFSELDAFTFWATRLRPLCQLPQYWQDRIHPNALSRDPVSRPPASSLLFSCMHRDCTSSAAGLSLSQRTVPEVSASSPSCPGRWGCSSCRQSRFVESSLYICQCRVQICLSMRWESMIWEWPKILIDWLFHTLIKQWRRKHLHIAKKEKEQGCSVADSSWKSKRKEIKIRSFYLERGESYFWGQNSAVIRSLFWNVLPHSSSW